ncbi:MAG: hypothetical protein SGILL_004425 [Bacillariaceae sp.]
MRTQVPKTSSYSKGEKASAADIHKLNSSDTTTPMSSDESEGSAPHEVTDCDSEEEPEESQNADEDDDEGEYEVALNDTSATKASGDDAEKEESDDAGDTGTETGTDSGSEEMSVASFSAINFTEFVEMYEIDCEYTSEEEAIMWFSSEEYSQFLEQCEDKANKITDKHGEENVTDNMKVRDLLGLEAWTREGYKKRQKSRLTSIDVVLDEQFSQWDDGKEDPESIAELYGASTAQSRLNASTKGMHLERDVKGFLKSTLGADYDQMKSLSRHGSMSSIGSIGSLGSLHSSEGDMSDDLSIGDVDDDRPKKKVVKKKVVKKKNPSGSGWSKVDPKAPQPHNKYTKKTPMSTRKLNTVSSTRRLDTQKQLSSSSLDSQGSEHSRNSSRSAPNMRGPVRLTPSPPSSIRSLNGARNGAPPRNRSVGGRRKPAALAAASKLTRQSAQRGGFAPPKKHQPMSGRNLMGKKMPPKKQTSKNMAYVNRPGAYKIPLSKAAAEIKAEKSLRGRFTRSEVMPAYNTPVSGTGNKKALAKKKQELQAQLKMVEQEEKKIATSKRNLATSSRKLTTGPEKKEKKKSSGMISKLRIRK